MNTTNKITIGSTWRRKTGDCKGAIAEVTESDAAVTRATYKPPAQGQKPWAVGGCKFPTETWTERFDFVAPAPPGPEHPEQ